MLGFKATLDMSPGPHHARVFLSPHKVHDQTCPHFASAKSFTMSRQLIGMP